MGVPATNYAIDYDGFTISAPREHIADAIAAFQTMPAREHGPFMASVNPDPARWSAAADPAPWRRDTTAPVVHARVRARART